MSLRRIEGFADSHRLAASGDGNLYYLIENPKSYSDKVKNGEPVAMDGWKYNLPKKQESIIPTGISKTTTPFNKDNIYDERYLDINIKSNCKRKYPKNKNIKQKPNGKRGINVYDRVTKRLDNEIYLMDGNDHDYSEEEEDEEEDENSSDDVSSLNSTSSEEYDENWANTMTSCW